MSPARKLLFIGLVALGPWAHAQQPVAPPGQQEGFFRPAADPALTRFPSTSEIVATPPLPRDAIAVPVDPNALAAQQRSREAAERELDRAQREARANADVAAKPTPMIVSPLDGTAPIVSPLGR